jgi:hypothetical protein
MQMLLQARDRFVMPFPEGANSPESISVDQRYFSPSLLS